MMTQDEKIHESGHEAGEEGGRPLKKSPSAVSLSGEDKIIGRGYNKRNLKKYPCPCGNYCDQQSQQSDRRLAPGRLHHVHHIGTLPDVCRSNCAGENPQSGHRFHESESRLCRICTECAQTDGFNHQVEVETGVLGAECSEMLSSFFRELRKIKKPGKAGRTVLDRQIKTGYTG